MANDITYCSQCDNLCQSTAKRHPAQWQCIKFPRINGFGFMSQDWIEEPYMRCQGINGGHCPLFTPIREVETTLDMERIHRSNFEQKQQDK